MKHITILSTIGLFIILCAVSAQADNKPMFIVCQETCQHSCTEKMHECKQVEQCINYTRKHCERDCWQECDKSGK